MTMPHRESGRDFQPLFQGGTQDRVFIAAYFSFQVGLCVHELRELEELVSNATAARLLRPAASAAARLKCRCVARGRGC